MVSAVKWTTLLLVTAGPRSSQKATDDAVMPRLHEYVRVLRRWLQTTLVTAGDHSSQVTSSSSRHDVVSLTIIYLAARCRVALWHCGRSRLQTEHHIISRWQRHIGARERSAARRVAPSINQSLEYRMYSLRCDEPIANSWQFSQLLRHSVVKPRREGALRNGDVSGSHQGCPICSPCKKNPLRWNLWLRRGLTRDVSKSATFVYELQQTSDRSLLVFS